MALAAISSSRMAIHARPMRENCSRWLIISTGEQHQHQEQVVIHSVTEEATSKPPMCSGTWVHAKRT